MELSNSLNKSFDPETYAGECEAHGPFVGKRYQLASRTFESGCPVCAKEKAAAEEARQKEEHRRQSIALFERIATEKRRKAGIPPRFDDRTFDTFKTDTAGRTRAKAAMQALVDDLLAGGSGHNVILTGKPGTGKSHLCCAAVHALYESRLVRRVVMADLIRHIRDTWRKDAERTESDVLRHYGEEVELLLIEEVGTTTGSEDEKARIFAVLNARYEHCRPTVIVSNLGKEALTAELGERVMDRLREGRGVLVPFDWESARGAA